MMRALLISVAVALPCAAQPVAVAPWMTGTRLVEMVTFPPDAMGNLNLTREQFLAAERARLYVEGVHDATEGKTWCYSDRCRPGPDALRDQAEVALRALSREQLKRNTADLIADIWRSKWPCPAGRGKR